MMEYLKMFFGILICIIEFVNNWVLNKNLIVIVNIIVRIKCVVIYMYLGNRSIWRNV